MAWEAGSGDRLIGDSAKNQATINPEKTVFDVKRLIVRGFKDKTVKKDMKHWPFKVTKKGDMPAIEVTVGEEKKSFYPEEISAMVLKKMKSVAESDLSKKN